MSSCRASAGGFAISQLESDGGTAKFATRRGSDEDAISLACGLCDLIRRKARPASLCAAFARAAPALASDVAALRSTSTRTRRPRSHAARCVRTHRVGCSSREPQATYGKHMNYINALRG